MNPLFLYAAAALTPSAYDYPSSPLPAPESEPKAPVCTCGGSSKRHCMGPHAAAKIARAEAKRARLATRGPR